jgi:hypothetical protein
MLFDYMNVQLIFHQTEAYPQSLDEVAETFTSIFLGGLRRPGAEEIP